MVQGCRGAGVQGETAPQSKDGDEGCSSAGGALKVNYALTVINGAVGARCRVQGAGCKSELCSLTPISRCNVDVCMYMRLVAACCALRPRLGQAQARSPARHQPINRLVINQSTELVAHPRCDILQVFFKSSSSLLSSDDQTR